MYHRTPSSRRAHRAEKREEIPRRKIARWPVSASPAPAAKSAAPLPDESAKRAAHVVAARRESVAPAEARASIKQEIARPARACCAHAARARRACQRDNRVQSTPMPKMHAGGHKKRTARNVGIAGKVAVARRAWAARRRARQISRRSPPHEAVAYLLSAPAAAGGEEEGGRRRAVPAGGDARREVAPPSILPVKNIAPEINRAGPVVVMRAAPSFEMSQSAARSGSIKRAGSRAWQTACARLAARQLHVVWRSGAISRRQPGDTASYQSREALAQGVCAHRPAAAKRRRRT